MFDILVFLFENYFEVNRHPDMNAVQRELTAAGFDDSEITQAFDWLNGLDVLAEAEYPESLADSRSVRIYADFELERINTESRGFLAFLESSGVLSPIQREWVLDRVFALSEPEATLEQVKWIVLMVLWKQGRVDEYLFLEDLLLDEGEVPCH